MKIRSFFALECKPYTPQCRGNYKNDIFIVPLFSLFTLIDSNILMSMSRFCVHIVIYFLKYVKI